MDDDSYRPQAAHRNMQRAVPCKPRYLLCADVKASVRGDVRDRMELS
jgi:hypothetical protein